MRTRLVMAAVSALLLSCAAAQAHDGWGTGGWSGRGDDARHLRWGCERGDRRACFELGRAAEDRRHAERREYRREWEGRAWWDRRG